MLAMALAGCSSPTGGTSESQPRGVDAFHSVDLRAAADVSVQVGPAVSVVVTADAESLDNISTTVQNGMLVIDQHGSWLNLRNHKVRVAITVPELKAFAVNGAGNVTIDAVQSDALALVLQGAANLTASGNTRLLNARINGAGNMDLTRLGAEQATVAVNGAGNLQLRATVSLEAEVNGVGAIEYAGNPPRVEPRISGVGRIAPLPPESI
jgi:hypothetical protein